MKKQKTLALAKAVGTTVGRILNYGNSEQVEDQELHAVAHRQRMSISMSVFLDLNQKLLFNRTILELMPQLHDEG